MTDGWQMKHPNLTVSQICTDSTLTQLLTAASNFSNLAVTVVMCYSDGQILISKRTCIMAVLSSNDFYRCHYSVMI